MTDNFGSLDSARETIESQVQQARERSLVMDALAEQINTMTATVRSPRGEVTVTALATAAITKVELGITADSLGPDALGKLITETIARAQRAAAELAIQATEEALGATSGLAATLRADVDGRFGPDDALR